MGVSERPRRLFQPGKGLGLLHLLLRLEKVSKIDSVHKLHHHEIDAFVLPRLEDPHQILMLHCGTCLRLMHEARHKFLLSRELPGKKLDRNLQPRIFVLRGIDHPHRPAPQKARETVGTKGGADQGVGSHAENGIASCKAARVYWSP